MSRTSSDTTWPTYRRLLSYAGKYRLVFLIGLLAMTLSAVGETATAWLVKPLLDDGFVDKDPDVIRMIPVGLIAIAMMRGLGTFGSTYSMGWVARHVIKTLRQEVFEKLLIMPAGYYDRSTGGSLVSKITYNIEQIAESSSRAMIVILGDSLKIILLLGYMLYMSWQLTVMIFILTPVMALIIRYVSKRFRRISTRIQSSMGDVTHVSEEIVQGQRVIKVFRGEEYERNRFHEVNERNRTLFMKLLATKAGSVPIVQLIGSAGIALIIYYSAAGGAGIDFTAGDFASYLGAMIFLSQPMKHLTEINEPLQRGIAAAKSIFEMLDAEPQVDHGTQELHTINGEVRFNDVRFSYDNSKGEVLRGISFVAPAGKTIALVGRSGSGKTTLVSLLPRFYELSSGSITIDGQDIRDVKLSSLRDHIALVSQDVVLFNDTIRKNIAYGALKDSTDEEILAAAKSAHALEFIEKLPDGLDTIVGDRGLLLSGGQRQRLAIARALLKNAPILILDEATSALDTESERSIQAGLDVLMKSRTTFVIAHRLSTIEKADLILVMQDGKLIEQGTHAELLARDGSYALLHKMQFTELET